MKVGIIGLGLIGGSYALALKQTSQAKIYGEDKYHLKKALKMGIADEQLTQENMDKMDYIIIATPVNTIAHIAEEVLNHISENCLVLDAGSIKHKIALKIKNHPRRKNFLLSHPIAGTEYSGPEAAFGNLYKNKINIFCDTKDTDSELLKRAYRLMKTLEMKTIEMDSFEHDRHIAYVSHLSHISSFMLGKTVMDLEKDEKNIFDMAGSGFASTVRLAKSSPNTWTPIFMENKENILQSLDEYISNLQDFKNKLEKDKKTDIKQSLININHIKEIIDKLENHE
jgi:prephenate dehydrogenase